MPTTGSSTYGSPNAWVPAYGTLNLGLIFPLFAGATLVLLARWVRSTCRRQSRPPPTSNTFTTGFLDNDLAAARKMLKAKGISVFPPEIEALLGPHPAVSGSGMVQGAHGRL